MTWSPKRAHQFCSVNSRAYSRAATHLKRSGAWCAGAFLRFRTFAAALVAVAIMAVAFAAPAAAIGDGTAALRADELIGVAGLEPDQLPELRTVSIEIQNWIVQMEREAAVRAVAVDQIEAELAPLLSEVATLRERRELIEIAVVDQPITKSIAALRNELPGIQSGIDNALHLEKLLVTRQIAERAHQARALDALMIAWNLRQEVAVVLADIKNEAPLAGSVLDGWAQGRLDEAVEAVIALPDVDLEPVFIVLPPTASRETSMVWPALGALNSAYGMRQHPVWGGYRMHTGVDIDADYLDDVVATSGGVVVRAGWNGGYGNTVEVDHGDGLSTLYAHLSEINVALDDTVEQGQTVGLIGATGTATDAHLHFEVRVDGVHDDPLDYLP